MQEIRFSLRVAQVPGYCSYSGKSMLSKPGPTCIAVAALLIRISLVIQQLDLMVFLCRPGTTHLHYSVSHLQGRVRKLTQDFLPG